MNESLLRGIYLVVYLVDVWCSIIGIWWQFIELQLVQVAHMSSCTQPYVFLWKEDRAKESFRLWKVSILFNIDHFHFPTYTIEI